MWIDFDIAFKFIYLSRSNRFKSWGMNLDPGAKLRDGIGYFVLLLPLSKTPQQSRKREGAGAEARASLLLIKGMCSLCVPGKVHWCLIYIAQKRIKVSQDIEHMTYLITMLTISRKTERLTFVVRLVISMISTEFNSPYMHYADKWNSHNWKTLQAGTLREWWKGNGQSSSGFGHIQLPLSI